MPRTTTTSPNWCRAAGPRSAATAASSSSSRADEHWRLRPAGPCCSRSRRPDRCIGHAVEARDQCRRPSHRVLEFGAASPGGAGHLFTYDRSTGIVKPIASTASGAGNSAASISADGRYVAYQSDSLGGHSEIYLYDLSTGQVIFHTANAGASYNPVISPDGHFIIFASDAQLTGDDNNAFTDTYVVDVTDPSHPVYKLVSVLDVAPRAMPRPILAAPSAPADSSSRSAAGPRIFQMATGRAPAIFLSSIRLRATAPLFWKAAIRPRRSRRAASSS